MYALPVHKSIFYKEYIIPASGFVISESAFPGMEEIGSTVKNTTFAFADSGSETVNFMFFTPYNLDTTGTATLTIIGRPKTPVSSRYVEFDFKHYARTSGENMDGSYTAVNSGDLAVTGTSGLTDNLSWTVSISTLTWATGDFVNCQLTRTAPAGTNLTGDYYVIAFIIKIPCRGF